MCKWLWKCNRANFKPFILYTQIMKLSNCTLFAQFWNVLLGKYHHGVLLLHLHFDFALRAFSTRAAKDFHVTTLDRNAWICKSFLQCNTVITICQLRKHTKAFSREEHLNAINVIHIWRVLEKLHHSEMDTSAYYQWIRPRHKIICCASREALVSIVISGGSVCVILPNRCECAACVLQ